MEHTDTEVSRNAEPSAGARARMLVVLFVGMGIVAGGVHLVVQGLSGDAPVARARAVSRERSDRPANTFNASDVVVDWDSPASVVEASIRYSVMPDAEKFRETVTASGPDEQQLVDAMTEIFVIAQELNDLAKARFGPEARVGLVPSREDLPAIDPKRWYVHIEGDTATVAIARGLGPRVQHLKRVDGKWKVQIYETMGPGISPGTPAGELADRLVRTAAAMRSTLGEMLKGRFDSAEEAEEFLDKQAQGKGIEARDR